MVKQPSRPAETLKRPAESATSPNAKMHPALALVRASYVRRLTGEGMSNDEAKDSARAKTKEVLHPALKLGIESAKRGRLKGEARDQFLIGFVSGALARESL